LANRIAESVVAQPRSSPAPSVEILSEEETSHGWLYRVQVIRTDGAPTDHEVTLAWVDHDHWCGGRLAPSTVMEALIRLLVQREDLRPIPARFDASTARRWHPSLDRDLAGLG
jgi:hypothetical protein